MGFLVVPRTDSPLYPNQEARTWVVLLYTVIASHAVHVYLCACHSCERPATATITRNLTLISQPVGLSRTRWLTLLAWAVNDTYQRYLRGICPKEGQPAAVQYASWASRLNDPICIDLQDARSINRYESKNEHVGGDVRKGRVCRLNMAGGRKGESRYRMDRGWKKWR